MYAKVPIIGVLEVARTSVGLFFEFGNLLVQKRTSFLDIMNVICIAQSALATEFLGGTATAGFERFGFGVFFIGYYRGHVIGRFIKLGVTFVRVRQNGGLRGGL
jgi:hypothetical protein